MHKIMKNSLQKVIKMTRSTKGPKYHQPKNGNKNSSHIHGKTKDLGSIKARHIKTISAGLTA